MSSHLPENAQSVQMKWAKVRNHACVYVNISIYGTRIYIFAIMVYHIRYNKLNVDDRQTTFSNNY